MRPRTVLIGLLLLSLALLTPAVVLGAEQANGEAAVVQPEQSENATIERIEAWQAPANATVFDDAADVRSAIEGGTLSRATGINGSHGLVVEMELRGFEGAVADANGSTSTERFRTALGKHGGLEIRQTDMGPNQAPLSVDALDGTGVTVHPDAANGTYYLSIDLGDASLVRNGSPGDFQRSGTHEFDVLAHLEANTTLTAERAVAMTAVAPRDASVETAPDDRVQLRPLPDQTVTGTTNIGAGSTVTVVVRGETNPDTDANESFRLLREATVGMTEDRFRHEGQFATTLDLRDVSPAATDVTVDVRIGNRSLLDQPVPARVNDYRASIDARDVVLAGGSAGVTVDGSLSAGGFLVLREGSPDGRLLGHSPYLEPGDSGTTVFLDRPTVAADVVVVAYRDANHNEWFDGVDTDRPYPGDGTTDTARIDVDLTATATPGPTETGTTPGAGTPGTPRSGEEPTTTQSSGSTGIGGTILPALGVLIAGVLFVALASVR